MDVEEIIRSRLQEADDLLSRGAAYSGFVRLGEVLRFVERRVSRQRQHAWRELVVEKARQIDLSSIQAASAAAVGRLERMLSAAGAYDTYEIVLLLTLRLELEGAEALLTSLGQPIGLVPEQLDDDVRALRADNQNRKAYEDALSMLRRNWGFPIESEWLA